MPTLLFTHPSSDAHVTPPGHPEQVARLEYIRTALSGPAFDNLQRVIAPEGALDDVLRCHPAAYLARIRAALPASGWSSLDGDTHLVAASLDAALHGVGANVAAVEAVVAGRAQNAFIACRPPGHHAERETAMGFCLFGNVSIAAKYALDHLGFARVAIVDFDVHHGNGTQDLIWDEPRCLFASTHQMPLFPGSGAAHERGAHNNILNVPLASGSGSREMRAAYEQVILPAVRDFAPELILISAGFDAHRADPLAGLNWETTDYRWLTAAICDVADEVCAGRLVSTLEGGYDLTALAASVAAHVNVLMERAK